MIQIYSYWHSHPNRIYHRNKPARCPWLQWAPDLKFEFFFPSPELWPWFNKKNKKLHDHATPFLINIYSLWIHSVCRCNLHHSIWSFNILLGNPQAFNCHCGQMAQKKGYTGESQGLILPLTKTKKIEDETSTWVGHLITILAPWVRNFNEPTFKSSNSWGGGGKKKPVCSKA